MTGSRIWSMKRAYTVAYSFAMNDSIAHEMIRASDMTTKRQLHETMSYKGTNKPKKSSMITCLRDRKI